MVREYNDKMIRSNKGRFKFSCPVCRCKKVRRRGEICGHCKSEIPIDKFYPKENKEHA